ncbi:MAG: glycosyltransferase family 2 protein, partial [Deltaproteobacteria bacterium]|nr:glycosyltransferase family 2 protein [Deltaproteobacteria bacterium]
AIRRALATAEPPDLFYLHNPDARVRPGALRTALEFLEQRSDVGVVGTQILDPGSGVHASAFTFPSVLSELEGGLRFGPVTRLLRKHSVWANTPTQTAEVDWVSGASVFFRREVFEAVGLFDENFFLYFEETDLCRRCREAGWKIVYLHEAVVEHDEGAATGITNKKKRVPGFWLDSRRYYFLKALGRRGLWMANAAWIGSHALWRVRRAVQRLPDDDPPQLLTDFVRHSLGLPRDG